MMPAVWANTPSSANQLVTLSEASSAAGLVNGGQQHLLKQGIDIKQFALGVQEAYRAEPSVERLQLADETITALNITAAKTTLSAETKLSAETRLSTENKLSTEIVAQASFDVGLVLAMSIKQPFKELDIAAFTEGFKKSYKHGVTSPKSAAAALVLSNYFQQQRMLGVNERLMQSQAFLAENAKHKGIVITKTGLQYEVLEQGKGTKPTILDMVVVSYREAKLNDDLSYTFAEGLKNETYALRGDIPEGWVELFLLMNKGGRYRVFLPPALGYGAAGLGEQILPNSLLITEFTLLDTIPPPPVNF
jgi:FKBP-type peptidyl-prolyl cis-trans isomerase